jgi:hypothetical protein
MEPCVQCWARLTQALSRHRQDQPPGILDSGTEPNHRYTVDPPSVRAECSSWTRRFDYVIARRSFSLWRSSCERVAAPPLLPTIWSVTRAAANRSNACGFGAGSMTPYWKLTAASARSTLGCGQRVTGPGAAPGPAILVPCPGRFRIRWPAAFDTVTAPSIRNTPRA